MTKKKPLHPDFWSNPKEAESLYERIKAERKNGLTDYNTVVNFAMKTRKCISRFL